MNLNSLCRVLYILMFQLSTYVILHTGTVAASGSNKATVQGHLLTEKL